jgi:hypothetical protein
MKKIDVGQTMNTIANLGVIVGIVFLAIEVHQSTETQRLSAAQQVLGLSYSNWTVQSSQEAYSSIFAALNAGEGLSPEDAIQFDNMMHSIFAGFWQVHFQHENGFLDDEIFNAYERRMSGWIMIAPINDFWTRRKSSYGDDFQLWVDSLIQRRSGDGP